MVGSKSGIPREKLARILAAARNRFGHYGLSKTTMADIAQDIGMSKASLYYYFKDKEDIFIAVIRKEQALFVGEMEKIIHASYQPEWMLEEYVTRRTDLLKQMLTLGKFSQGGFTQMKPVIGDLVNAFRKKEVALISKILKIAIQQKQIQLRETKRYAEFFIDTLRGIRRLGLSTHDIEDTIDLSEKQYQKLRQHSKLFAGIFMNGLSGVAK